MLYEAASGDDMAALGRRIALSCVHGAWIIYLQGELGTGKTTLVRGFLRGLGFQGRVKSPTYTLVEPYDIDGRPVFHFDLYRVTDGEELEQFGIRDYFAEGAICLVEWPDRAPQTLPVPDLWLILDYAASCHTVTFKACSEQGRKALAALAKSVALIQQMPG